MAGNPTPQSENVPQFVRPDFDRMPEELKRRPNWVLWVPVWNGSKWTKRPIQVSGFGASTKNPKHWSSFEDVRQAYELAFGRGYIELHEKGEPIQRIPIGGVGFVFDNQPDEEGLVFAGVDFDGVMPQKEGIASFARERVKRIRSYCEASVSGTGVHVILRAYPLASGIAHNGVELYTGGRFFTMTGRTARNTPPLIAAPDAFAALAEELRTQTARRGPHEAQSAPKLDLNEFESAACYLAALNPSRLQDYHGWRDFMFACAHAEIVCPAQAEAVRSLFEEVSEKAGGDTSNNGTLFDGALRATEEKLTRGEPVMTARTIIDKTGAMTMMNLRNASMQC
jgi:hypothetical protein